MGVPSPEYPRSMIVLFLRSQFLLLPAHSAPLGMAFHDGRHLPNLSMQRGLFVALRGYRSTGHRIVYVPFNRLLGRTCLHRKLSMLFLVGINQMGFQRVSIPLDIRVSDDGALFISDDRNGKKNSFKRISESILKKIQYY